MLTRLKNFSLFQQFIVPMIVVGIAALTATLYSASVLQESVKALGQLQIDGDERLRVIEDIETNIAYFRALSLRHMASESSSSMSELHAKLEQTKESLQLSFDLITNVLIDSRPVSLEEAQTLLIVTSQYIDEIDQVITLSADFEKELAFIHMTRAENEYLAGINSALQQLKRHEFEDLVRLRDSLISATERNLKTTMIIGISGGILVLIIAFGVTRRITNRLSGLLRWSKAVSTGNLHATLEPDSHDEVGLLTRSMKDMANSIAEAHSQLKVAKDNAEMVADELQIYANAFENSGESILITDRDNRILNVNAAFTRETGYELKDLAGKNPSILSSGQTPRSIYQEMWNELNENGFWQGELWDKRKDGEVFPKWAAISAIRDTQGKLLFYISTSTNIRDRKEAEAQIEHLAHHDILTGLQNRFSMEVQLEQAIAIATREQSKLAVLFIDLDRFKNINDSLGHHTGDGLLVSVANRLKECVRESDIVARVGGDEFVIVITDISEITTAAVLAEKILSRISMPYTVDGKDLTTSPSIGISVFPEDGRSVDDLIRTADVAMYHAKEHGRNNFQYFTESMLVAANKRIELERDLRNALMKNQFFLHYQPQVQSPGQKVVTVEALVRWAHPDQGIIPPDHFIPVAEETDIIHDLGRWVFNESFSQLVEWKALGLTGLKIAVNLSTKQLQSKTLCNEIVHLLKDHQLDGEEIELEITETAAMNEPEQAIRHLNQLRDLGVSLSIDDFGTGHSSLAYLKRLPIQNLKLDRSFVRDIETDTNDAEICLAALALAHNLGLQVVAEGVETQAQRDFLTAHGCDFLQGYLFSRPLPADEIVDYISCHSQQLSEDQKGIVY
jgi:diguanylate cyclase (GGDEF)-like protein/PAS domain S-box-containing protein